LGCRIRAGPWAIVWDDPTARELPIRPLQL
jgi:hypothetical protein